MLNTPIKKAAQMSGYFIIPFMTVWLCVGLRIAQGEKNEEIVFGFMLGLVLDLIYGVALALAAKNKRKPR